MAEKETKAAITGQTDNPHEISFKYIKSNLFRVVHANGAFGGLSGRGELHIGFYSERLEFPDTSKVLVSPTGEVSHEVFEGIGKHVREIEVDVVVDIDTAKQLRAWLDNKITSVEMIIKEAQKEAASHAEEIAIPKA